MTISPKDLDEAIEALTCLRDLIFEDGADEKENERERKRRQALLTAIEALQALKNGDLVPRRMGEEEWNTKKLLEDMYKYREALE